jgi:hypothetical protein
MKYMRVCLLPCGGRKIIKSQESGKVPGSNVTPHSISPAEEVIKLCISEETADHWKSANISETLLYLIITRLNLLQ